jgi:spermidine/putrescine transport system permease protein
MILQKNNIHIFLSCFVGLVYLFLYVPLIILFVFSYNSNIFAQDWEQFTLHWYIALLHDVEVWDALKNSLIVATLSTVLSLSMAALFVFFCNKFYIKRFMIFIYASLAMPEIVIAVAMLSFFSCINVTLGITTLVAGHTLLGLGYAVPIIYTRFEEIDMRLVEASRDLGATPLQAFFTIILPLLIPAFVSAALLIFIISLDDFIISFFCVSASVQTLPLYIYSVIRSGATPLVNALSVLLLMVSSFLILCFSFFQMSKQGKGK